MFLNVYLYARLGFCFVSFRCVSTTLHVLCTDFPDWTIAAAGSEASVRIGYDYGRLVTGEIESDFDEEAVPVDGD